MMSQPKRWIGWRRFISQWGALPFAMILAMLVVPSIKDAIMWRALKFQDHYIFGDFFERMQQLSERGHGSLAFSDAGRLKWMAVCRAIGRDRQEVERAVAEATGLPEVSIQSDYVSVVPYLLFVKSDGEAYLLLGGESFFSDSPGSTICFDAATTQLTSAPWHQGQDSYDLVIEGKLFRPQ